MDLDPKAIMGGAAKLVGDPTERSSFRADGRRGLLRRTVHPQRPGRTGATAPGCAVAAGLRALRDDRRSDCGRCRPPRRPHRGDRRTRQLSYKELDQRSNALANAWRERGLSAGEGVAILVRNHRGFLEAVFAAAKSGARIVLLNTSFAGPQIREVVEREGTDLLVYDEEYADALKGVDDPRAVGGARGPTNPARTPRRLDRGR